MPSAPSQMASLVRLRPGVYTQHSCDINSVHRMPSLFLKSFTAFDQNPKLVDETIRPKLGSNTRDLCDCQRPGIRLNHGREQTICNGDQTSYSCGQGLVEDCDRRSSVDAYSADSQTVTVSDLDLSDLDLSKILRENQNREKGQL